MKIVKIKVSTNIKYELVNEGYIKANSMIKELFKNKHITKKCRNVVMSIENLLYDNMEVKEAYYNMLTNEVELHLVPFELELMPNSYCEYCDGLLYSNYICSECGEELEMK